MAKQLLGKEVTASLNERIKAQVAQLQEKGITPTLGIIRVGENPSDLSYERGATKRCETLGVACEKIVLPEDVSQDELLKVIDDVNKNDKIHGVLLFRPLPKHLDQAVIENALDPEKDVDCMTDGSMSGVFTGKKIGFPPCTPQACMEILDYYNIDCTWDEGQDEYDWFLKGSDTFTRHERSDGTKEEDFMDYTSDEFNEAYPMSRTDYIPLESVPSDITATSVSFDGKLFLNTYIVLSDEIAADDDAYVSVTFNGVTTEHLVPDLLAEVDSVGRVKVRQEVYAAMMRDEMTLKVYSGDGTLQPLTYKETLDVTDGFVYTALDYLKGRQENSTNAKMVELARAAELYGIATQVYFNYKTEQLTSADIAAMQAAAGDITIPATCDEIVTGTLPSGITNRAKTVLFESDNSLKMYFYFDDALLNNYTFRIDGNVVTPVKTATGTYYVQKDNIASGLLSNRYEFSVTDGTDTLTVSVSTLSYAYSRQQNSANANMRNLSKLLYRYSMAADAYFGN